MVKSLLQIEEVTQSPFIVDMKISSTTTNNNQQQTFGTLIKVIGDNDGIKFEYPIDVKLNSKGELIVASNHKIDILSSGDYKLVKTIGSQNHGNKNGEFNIPYSCDIDLFDNILVSDFGNHRVQIFDSNGKWINTFGKQGSDYGCLNYYRGITVDNENGDIYVFDSNNNRLVVF